MVILLFTLLLLMCLYIAIVTFFSYNIQRTETNLSFLNRFSSLRIFLFIHFSIVILCMGLLFLSDSLKMRLLLMIPIVLILISLFSYIRVRKDIKPKRNRKLEKKIIKTTFKYSYLLPAYVSLKKVNCYIFQQIRSSSRAELYIYLKSDEELKDSLEKFIQQIKRESDFLIIVRIFLNGKKVYPK